jgi:peptidoglycan/xylan/chitin deacetylase (PgdA/CDA1 family)
LYAAWEKRDSLLVTKEQFDEDMTANISQLDKFGVNNAGIKYFLAPYEWYNQTIGHWTTQRRMQLINFTPGIGTNADYTTPEMPNYRSSRQLKEQLMKFELSDPDGLNGSIILIHLGTHPDRKDKFYNSLDQIIQNLSKKGYSFEKLP